MTAALLSLGAGCEYGALPNNNPTPDAAVLAHALPPSGGAVEICGALEEPVTKMLIGTPLAGSCQLADEHAPYIEAYLANGGISALRSGESWTVAGDLGFPMAAFWRPAGTKGPAVEVQRATLRIVSVLPTIVVHYDFDTDDGIRWSGDASLTDCHVAPTCGG